MLQATLKNIYAHVQSSLLLDLYTRSKQFLYVRMLETKKKKKRENVCLFVCCFLFCFVCFVVVVALARGIPQGVGDGGKRSRINFNVAIIPPWLVIIGFTQLF